MDENHLEKSDGQGTHSSDEQQAQVVLRTPNWLKPEKDRVRYN